MSSEYEKFESENYITFHGAEEAENTERFFKLPLIYSNLSEIFELFQKNFGFQIFVTLGAIVIFFVLMCYVAITNEDWKLFTVVTIFIILYIVITIALSTASQKIPRYLDSSYVTMTKINFLLAAGGKNNPYVKGLMRLSSLRSRDGGLRCFGGLALGTPLLTAVLSVSASYTIVVLQFANII